MWRKVLPAGVLCGVMCICCFANDFHAVSFLSLRIVPDGSSDPPGDTIDVQLSPSAFVEGARIRVRAFTVVEGRKTPVLAARPNLDREVFEILIPLSKGGTPDDPTRTIVIPFADLKIGSGRHVLAYLVELLVDGRCVFSQATDGTELIVREGSRTTMERGTIRREISEHKRRVPVLKNDSSPSKDDSILPTHPHTDITDYERTAKVTRERVTVHIPNGFERKSLPHVDVAANDSPIDSALVPLPSVPLSQVAGDDKRLMYFFTNRKRAPAAVVADGGEKPVKVKVRPLFTAESASTLEYGHCLVDIPVRFHRAGVLETLQWWEPREPGRAFVVESTSVLSREIFLAKDSEKDVLVYVHGFNNSFDDAILRAAQLTYDLQFPGKAVAFCWPSRGDFSKYEEDAAQISSSASALAEGLRNLVHALAKDGQGQRKIHILSHSMGTRILLLALYKLRESEPELAQHAIFDQIVLAAPDVGAATFNQLLDHTLRSSRQVTYYFCRKDAALRISQNINHYEPVGLFPYFDRKLTTINADAVDTSFLGHIYFSSAPEILHDMRLLFLQGLSPNHRMPPLAGQETVFGNEYWVFNKIKGNQSVPVPAGE
jgi:esterase/lipase superfamily enzyme